MNRSLKKETSNAILEYSDHIVFVRLKEGVEISIGSMKEQYEAQRELVGNDEYTVLVDGTKNSIVSPETRQFMANYQPPNRKATAIVSNNNLATLLMANFYMKINRPKVKTKLFKHENQAVTWLKGQIKNM